MDDCVVAVTGVVAYFAGLTALGVILVTIYSILYLLACCKCCCFKTLHDKPVAGWFRWINIFLFFVSGACFVILAFASSGPAVGMARAAANFTDQISTILDQSKLIATEIEGVQMESDDGISSTLALQFTTQPENGAKMAMTGAFGEIHEVADRVLGNLTEADEDIVESRKDAEGVESYPNGVATAAAIFMAFVVLIFFSSLLHLPFCPIVHVVFSFILLVITILIWLLLGAIFAGGLATADFCVDPARVTFGVLNDAAALTDNDVAATALRTGAYYSLCGTNSSLEATGTFVELITDAHTVHSEAQGAMNVLLAARTTYPAQHEAIDQVNVHYEATGEHLAVADDQSQCSIINPLYWNLVTIMCNDVVGNNLVPFFGIFLACAILLIITMATNLMWCIRHPANTSDAAIIEKGSTPPAAAVVADPGFA